MLAALVHLAVAEVAAVQEESVLVARLIPQMAALVFHLT
jgi:hypothetical protein